MGSFKYSHVEGATANDLPDHVFDEVMEDRLQRPMAIQAEISVAKLPTRIGQEYLTLIDEVNELRAVGRSYMDAPEVDGKVHLSEVFNC